MPTSPAVGLDVCRAGFADVLGFSAGGLPMPHILKIMSVRKQQSWGEKILQLVRGDRLVSREGARLGRRGGEKDGRLKGKREK